MTEWRVIERFPAYEVSENGDVRRRVRLGSWPAGGQLNGSISNYGYRIFQLWRDGERRTMGSHALVCETWHGPCPEGKDQVAHFDGDNLNNHFSNLRWATAAENGDDTKRHGKRAGEKCPSHKLRTADVVEIRRLYDLKLATHQKLADQFGVTRSNISYILSGRTWRAAA